MNSKACGMLFFYNEQYILEDSLRYYLDAGFDLVLFDNESTDGSRYIVEQVKLRCPGRILEIVTVKTDGYQWRKILRMACDYMHAHLSSYDWIALIDADSFYHSPVDGLPLVDFLSQVKKNGFNIVDGKLFDFFPTEKDDLSITSPIKRLKYCDVHNGTAHKYPQHKIFQYHPDIDFYTHFGHICLREDARVAPVKLLYLHYKWVSFEHGRKKIFTERVPRFVERESHARFHPQYLGLLPIEDDLVKSAQQLILFHKEDHCIPQDKLVGLLTGNSESASNESAKKYYSKDLPKDPFWTITEKEWQARGPYANGLPMRYHFLMTDFCNAACIFCNQDFKRSGATSRQLTLSGFKTMISHVRLTRGSDIYMSGGGEPLLCKDLFKMIAFVNETCPMVPITIKSNGLLVGKFAEEIAKAGIARFGMSVHGARKESNNKILGLRTGMLDLFEGIPVLNEALDRYSNPMEKVFYFVASRLNIKEVPDLVRRAKELKVNDVMILFSKYLPDEFYETGNLPTAHPEDSLYYHQDLYDDVIRKSKALADSLGVSFRHEPLFSEPSKVEPCYQPWNTMVVNWDGEIYPCTGGEVWFRKKVRDRIYRFGNLRHEHISSFWNNETYTRIRRTLSDKTCDCFIPECTHCHNFGCFAGSHFKRSHIIEYPAASPEPKIGT
ncbi:MAG: SPASM domain-containing protein [Deltaproteobacteria bacterium]|jgi:radical SAM protein with 4Fe4S-binding SPASM domain|nr:SPASM domain-containing protein [Deltaproteobacteria bacterium]